MTIEHKFEWFTTDGGPFISLIDWVNTLSVEEQQIFYAAKQQHEEYRQQKVNDGSLVISEIGSYIWKDSEAALINKKNDLVWCAYWDRWQVETTSTCRMVIVKT